MVRSAIWKTNAANAVIVDMDLYSVVMDWGPEQMFEGVFLRVFQGQRLDRLGPINLLAGRRATTFAGRNGERKSRP